MNGFFICIVLIGIVITGVSLMLILADKSRNHDYRLDLGQKREALVETIEDAETLVEELNRFSDYVVTQCEQKQMEVKCEVQRADSLMGQLSAASAILESKLARVRSQAVPFSPDASAAGQTDADAESAENSTSFNTGSRFKEDSDSTVPHPVSAMPHTGSNVVAGPRHVPATVRTIRRPLPVKNGTDGLEPALPTSYGMEKGSGAATEPDGKNPAAQDRGRVVMLDARRMEALQLAKKGMTHVEIAKALNMGKGEIELIARIGSGS